MSWLLLPIILCFATGSLQPVSFPTEHCVIEVHSAATTPELAKESAQLMAYVFYQQQTFQPRLVPHGTPYTKDNLGNLQLYTWSTTRLYTGREYEKEIWLYYYRARFYSPKLWRFIGTTLDNTAWKVGSLAEPATAYFLSENQYVVVNNLTRTIVQVSDLNQAGWLVDPRILLP